MLDNFATGREENLRRTRAIVSCSSAATCAIARPWIARVAGCDFVLHQAALASVPRSIADPVANNEVNAQGTLNVLVAAQKHGVRRVVYASSSSIYGDSEELPKVESMIPNPKSPYAVAKLAAEYYCRVFADLHGMTTVALRYFNVFGPRQDPQSPYAAVIPLFLAAISNGTPPTIYGDGEQTRDFTYVENVVDANMAALSCADARGEALNIACGDRISLLRLLELLGHAAGRPATAKHAPPREGDVRHSQGHAPAQNA